MDELCEQLLDAGARPAGHGSKLARVLDTSPKSLPAEPLHRALAEQIGELLVWDRAVRAEADDAVHQMRVTARKIRSLLQAAPDSFGLADDAPIVDELRELGNVLGVARDAEVLADRYRSASGRCAAGAGPRTHSAAAGRAAPNSATGPGCDMRWPPCVYRDTSACSTTWMHWSTKRRRPARAGAGDRRRRRQEGLQGGKGRATGRRRSGPRRCDTPNP